jgi:hypothetical protein
MLPIKDPLRLRMRNGTFSFCCLIEWGCLTGPWGVGSPLACFELRNIYLTQMDISRPGEDLESIFLHILLAYFVETQSTGFSHNFHNCFVVHNGLDT